MKFGFVTCVQLGLSCMEAIYQSGGTLTLALTLPDAKAVNKSGRVYLDDFCRERTIPLAKFPHINDPEAIAELQRADLDYLFIIGWSQIANPAVLAAPRQGVLGMHPTLLPVGRGRAAIPWAILHGLPETGVTLFKLDEGVDTGLIGEQATIALTPQSTATWLYDQVALTHGSLMRKVYPKLASGSLTWRAQDETRATVWPGRTPADGRIDLAGSVMEAERLVRATTRPYPGAFFVHGGGEKVIVWSARIANQQPAAPFLAFRDGFLELLEVQEATSGS